MRESQPVLTALHCRETVPSANAFSSVYEKKCRLGENQQGEIEGGPDDKLEQLILYILNDRERVSSQYPEKVETSDSTTISPKGCCQSSEARMLLEIGY